MTSNLKNWGGKHSNRAMFKSSPKSDHISPRNKVFVTKVSQTITSFLRFSLLNYFLFCISIKKNITKIRDPILIIKNYCELE